jgi:acetyltransferase-like isoleucine patch superfamily enzyme
MPLNDHATMKFSFNEIYWYVRGAWKTIRFNLHYFNLLKAIRMPVLVSPRVRFINLHGAVVIPNNIKFGMIRLGHGNDPVSDREHTYTLWSNTGSIEFKGTARITHGCKIRCNGKIVFGSDFISGPECYFVSRSSISIGDRAIISWNTQICDSDFHAIEDLQGNQINTINKPIIIGHGVWIGNHVKICKGVVIGNFNIVAQSSVVTKSISGENQIIGGFPAKFIKGNARRIQD